MRNILFSGLCLLGAMTAGAQDATLPPADQHPVLMVKGQGVQIYTCKASQWVFVAPAARLFDASGVEIGSHGDGPVWHLEDGSSVLGKIIAKNPPPDNGSIPWLLLKSQGTTGVGKLQNVEFIRRSDTSGGVAPVAGCDTGTFARIPYSATYTFYSSK